MVDENDLKLTKIGDWTFLHFERAGACVTTIVGVTQADGTVLDSGGTSLLHLAAREDRTGCLEFILSQEQPEVDRRDEQGRTALGLASKLGFLGAVRLLVDRGAGVNVVDAAGYSPLHFAAMKNRV